MQLDAITHPFFDELRDPNSRLPNGRPLPPLFNFKAHGIVTLLIVSRLIFFFKQTHLHLPLCTC